MNLNNKEKIGLACLIGTIALSVAVPMCCARKNAETRFLMGGKQMLGAIPDMIKCYGTRLVRRIMT